MSDTHLLLGKFPVGEDEFPPLADGFVRYLRHDQLFDARMEDIEQIMDEDPDVLVLAFSKQMWAGYTAPLAAAWNKRRIFTVSDRAFLANLRVQWEEIS